MHVLGHVFIWLIAVGALAATVLSAKTYDVRNSWIKKVDQLKQDVEKNKPIIDEKVARLAALKQEMNKYTRGWGRPYLNVNGQLGQSFQLSLSDPALMGWLGSLDQAAQAAQVIYVFQPQPDGSSLYVGSFQLAGAVAAGATDGTFTPTWTPRNEDFIQELVQNPNGPFRVRPMVPALAMALTDRLLADKQDDLKEQLMREADAKAVRDKRNEQLQGQDGLVSQLKTAEDARNKELEELDYWRREVDDARREIETLLNESREMEKQLEPPSEGTPPVTTQVTRR
jgi:hypothetical protein